MSQLFKTEKYCFGVWKVGKRRQGQYASDHVQYWDSELDAWKHLLERAHAERLAATKELNRCGRNLAKAMNKVRILSEESTPKGADSVPNGSDSVTASVSQN